MTPDPWANDWAAEGLRALIPQTEFKGIKQLLQQGFLIDILLGILIRIRSATIKVAGISRFTSINWIFRKRNLQIITTMQNNTKNLLIQCGTSVLTNLCPAATPTRGRAASMASFALCLASSAKRRSGTMSWYSVSERVSKYCKYKESK